MRARQRRSKASYARAAASIASALERMKPSTVREPTARALGTAASATYSPPDLQGVGDLHAIASRRRAHTKVPFGYDDKDVFAGA